jgi:hypothetical protein
MVWLIEIQTLRNPPIAPMQWVGRRGVGGFAEEGEGYMKERNK